MADRVDPYRLLQVDPEADGEVIKAAYRRLARMYHPDIASGPEAAARMAAINAAWELIGDAAARRKFDRSRGVITHDDAATPGRAPRSTEAGGARGAERGGTTRPGGPVPPSTPADPASRPEQVSRDWTSGRSSVGGGYDPSMRAPDGTGAAGPPPGRPSGSVLNFGRYAGWSLGEIARTDLEFIEWLDRTPIGRTYRDEIDQLLRRAGRRSSDGDAADERRGLFRRR